MAIAASRWLLLVVYAGVLVGLSIAPGPEQPGDGAFRWLVANTSAPLQNGLHVFTYAVLSLMIVWSLGNSMTSRQRIVYAMIAATLFGAGLEWFQLSVPGRFGSIADIMLNTLGAVLGVVIAILLF